MSDAQIIMNEMRKHLARMLISEENIERIMSDVREVYDLGWEDGMKQMELSKNGAI